MKIERQMTNKKTHKCICGEIYSHRQSLKRHFKKCIKLSEQKKQEQLYKQQINSITNKIPIYSTLSNSIPFNITPPPLQSPMPLPSTLPLFPMLQSQLLSIQSSSLISSPLFHSGSKRKYSETNIQWDNTNCEYWKQLYIKTLKEKQLLESRLSKSNTLHFQITKCLLLKIIELIKNETKNTQQNLNTNFILKKLKVEHGGKRNGAGRPIIPYSKVKNKYSKIKQIGFFLSKIAGSDDDAKLLISDFFQKYSTENLNNLNNSDNLIIKIGEAARNLIFSLPNRSTFRKELISLLSTGKV